MFPMHLFLAAATLMHTLISPFDFNSENDRMENFSPVPLEQIEEGDLIVFGTSENDLQAIGLYLGNEQVMYTLKEDGKTEPLKSPLSDLEWPYSSAFRPLDHFEQALNNALEQSVNDNRQEILAFSDAATQFLAEHFDCYFVNEQHMPLAVSPKDDSLTLAYFQEWAAAHQYELKALISERGALLLRNFPLGSAEDFAGAIKSVIGRELIDYRGGEGSRKKVAEGVYTSTEAPPQFHIPLHNELSCTNHSPEYICFYCDKAPEPGSGQTILGITEAVTQDILQHPEIWDFFNGHAIKYISRHPPEGSFYSKVNPTHKTWPQAFETNDKLEVENICKQKGLAYRWLGDWLEVTRTVPAIQNPNRYFDHPYWFNQVHLYHANPRIRGGWMNHILANLLYYSPTTRQYDVELEDGTAIPREIIYGIYDVLERQTIKFDWQKEDALIVHNIKALHGRAPYQGQRRILVSMIQ